MFDFRRTSEQLPNNPHATQIKGSRISHPCRQLKWKLMRIQFMRVADNNVTQSDSNFLISVMLLCWFFKIMPPPNISHVLYIRLPLNRQVFSGRQWNMSLMHLYNHHGIKKKFVEHNKKPDFALTNGTKWLPFTLSPRILAQLFIKTQFNLINWFTIVLQSSFTAVLRVYARIKCFDCLFCQSFTSLQTYYCLQQHVKKKKQNKRYSFYLT